MSETADLSSDNERNLHYSPSSWATSSMSWYSITASSPDVIVISDSDNNEDKNLVINHVVKGEPKPEEIPRASIKHDILLFSY